VFFSKVLKACANATKMLDLIEEKLEIHLLGPRFVGLSGEYFR